MTPFLTEMQSMPVSGARAVEPFTVDGVRWLAVPQLAFDAPGAPPGINGGDSCTEVVLFAEGADGFERAGTLPVPGGEDVEVFSIGDRTFAAVASIRTGRGPYDLASRSPIYELASGGFTLVQELRTYAAKQVRHLTINGVDYLAVAQGMPGGDRTSAVLRWDGSAFVPFQQIPSAAGYNFAAIELGGEPFLAHADHAAASALYRFDGERFVLHQRLVPSGGRAFLALQDATGSHVAVARIDGDSLLYRWDGRRLVDPTPIPGGAGGREFARVETRDGSYVIRVDFIHGTPAEPQPDLVSHVYRFVDGTMQTVGGFRTAGATDVAVLPGDGCDVVVSNGLAARPEPGRTFAGSVTVYRFDPRAAVE